MQELAVCPTDRLVYTIDRVTNQQLYGQISE